MYRVTGTLRDRSLQQVSRIHETWDADRRRTIRKRIKVRAGESVSLRDTTSLAKYLEDKVSEDWGGAKVRIKRTRLTADERKAQRAETAAERRQLKLF